MEQDTNSRRALQFLLQPDIQDLLDSEDYRELYKRATRDLRDEEDDLTGILTCTLVSIGIDINKIISQLSNKIPEHFANRLEERAGITLPDLEISDNISTIESFAFTYCEGIKNVHFSDGVKEIGESAFEGCIGLEKLDLNKVSKIGNFAFEFCEGLREIKLPNIVYIGSDAFHGCASLERVYIHLVHSTVAFRIGYEAFAQCKSLRDVYVDNDAYEFNSAFGATAFNGCKNVTIHCTDKEFTLRA